MATAVDRGRGSATAGRLLENHTGRSAGAARVAKAGEAYVPLDPAYPEERLQYMLEDSGPVVLLTQGYLRGLFPRISPSLPVLDVTEAAHRWEEEGETNPDRAAVGLNAEHLAYVIYTSGSSGTPKGVMVEHGSVINFLCSMAERPGITSEDRLLAVTSISFDIAALELYLPLSKGARIVLANRNNAVDPDALRRILATHGITIMQATPTT